MAKRIYNQTSLFGPLYAFLVVLSPPAAIKARIARIKKELDAIAEIGDRNLNSIAHITLTDKLTDDADFADTVSSFIVSQPSFPVKLQGWGYFDHGHSITIYLNVVNPGPIIKLAELLKSSSKTPHISLAKKIPHETFEKLRPCLEELDFEEEWTCTGVTVLRKLMSEKHLGWKDSFRIPLTGI
jgi:2'-5' RNA ligase